MAPIGQSHGICNAFRYCRPIPDGKEFIADMIAKLEADAGHGATKKAYCGKVLTESNAKKLDNTAEVEH